MVEVFVGREEGVKEGVVVVVVLVGGGGGVVVVSLSTVFFGRTTIATVRGRDGHTRLHCWCRDGKSLTGSKRRTTVALSFCSASPPTAVLSFLGKVSSSSSLDAKTRRILYRAINGIPTGAWTGVFGSIILTKSCLGLFA